MVRGSIWWADLPEPIGSMPGYRRPVVVVQADSFNRSQIKTVIVATITSNLRISQAPGNVFLSARESGLPKDSVINVSQLLTIDKAFLDEKITDLPPTLLYLLEEGLRQVMEL